MKWKLPTRPLPGVRLDASDISALTNREPKLSRIPPAHWRGVFQLGIVADAMFALSLAKFGGDYVRGDPLGAGVWRERIRHVSAERCEHIGLIWAARTERQFGPGECRFLRAEKFEGEAP